MGMAMRRSCNTSQRRSHTAISVDTSSSGVCRITLDREDRLNALSEAMATELLDVCEKLRGVDGDEVRAVILTGRGRAFCTGRCHLPFLLLSSQ